MRLSVRLVAWVRRPANLALGAIRPVTEKIDFYKSLMWRQLQEAQFLAVQAGGYQQPGKG